MRTRREKLSPEARARTIQAGCAHALLTPYGDVPSDVACSGHVGVVMDPGGSAHLVVAPGGCAPEGRFRITCRARVPGLGVLRLEGRSGEAAPLADRPGIAAVLELHRSRWAEPTLDPGSPGVLVVPVELDAVTVLTPATDTQRAGVVPLELAAYSCATPDRWLLDADRVRTRLEAEHQDDLRSLARCHGALDAAAPAMSVSIRDLAPSHLDVACLSCDGVTCVTIRFGGTLEHPGHVRRWVSRAARRVA